MERIYDLIIIGAGPAGLSSGIYAGRAQMDVLIVEKGEDGGQIATTSEVVNYPGIKEISGSELGHKMKEQAADFGVEFIKAEVSDLDFSKEIKEIHTPAGIFKALSIIIATGATPRKLGFPGEKEFTGRGVAYCATCDGEFFKDKDVFVIGAGYAAAEEAIFLTKFARKVIVIAREPEFTCAKSIAEKVLNHPKIEVKFNTEIIEASGDMKLRRALFKDLITGETWEYKAAQNESFGIFVFIGYQPQSQLFKDHIELDNWGYAKTNEDLETSVQDVYAAGDIRAKKLRQVVTAVADGAIAATVLEKRVEEKRTHLGLEKIKKAQKNISSIKKEEIAHRFLDPSMREQLKDVFGRFQSAVKIAAVLDDSDLSKDISDFLLELKEISDIVQVELLQKGQNKELEEKIKAERYPTIAVLDSEDSYRGVKFSGLPSGHELNSFILALYNIAGPGQAVSESLLSSIKSIDDFVNMKIAVSLSCSLCPEVVTGAQRIAIENSKVEAEMIDIFSFPDLEKKYNIMGVPALIINNKDVYFGKRSLEEIIEAIKKSNN